MKIVIIGDCHGDNYYKNIRKASKEKPDYIIVCGDFGYLWDNTIRTQKTLNYISNSFSPIILFLDGNHENFDMIKKLDKVFMFGAFVGKVTDKIFHLQRGEVYKIGNKNFFVFGGAYSIDRMFRKEGVSWWRDELPSDEEKSLARKNINKYGSVDYVLTHTIPTKDVYDLGFNLVNDDTSDFLTEVESKLKYDKWFFGHFHLDIDLKNKIGLYKEIYIIDY